ncbi:hypothetical protein ACWGDT_10770 [Streptomyces avermitilis]
MTNSRGWGGARAPGTVAVGAVLGAGAGGRLKTQGYDDPRCDSSFAARVTAEHLGAAPNLVVVVQVPGGFADDAAAQRAGEDLTRRLAAQPQVSAVSSYWRGHAAELRSRDGRSAMLLAHVDGTGEELGVRVKRLREALTAAGPYTGGASSAAGPYNGGTTAEHPLPGRPPLGRPLPDRPLLDRPLLDRPLRGRPLRGRPLRGRPLPGRPLLDRPLRGRPPLGRPLRGRTLPGRPLLGRTLRGRLLRGRPRPDRWPAGRPPGRRRRGSRP